MAILKINANFDSDSKVRQFISQKEIFVLGTIHRLPENQEILKKFLLFIKPAVITVEISPYSVSLRRKKEKIWLKTFLEILAKEKLSLTPALENFRRILEMPYEYKIARELNIAPVVPVDLNAPARKYLKELEQALTPENLKKLTTMPFNPQREKGLVYLFLKGLYQPPVNPYDKLRETYMAKKIKTLAKRKPLVHIGGWRHLAGLTSHLKEVSTAIVLP
ncbi:hypothetical protein Thein_1545 [Thermodesulfatator indicus DSM 15286]|uniref:Haem-binding uptake Tiki superfamily ChaN domain-containing protein n=1 Tax=Thermodesulfatator indicus (strain DSM 15286 / JCM 11887 / CIR29812) TaxID=667014 RepID=F8AAI6_THEID|nr:hypothetical protein [Thermodesulfatator indicus]AEH45406.1 hypothetical protein Thein_1545 [Thermodesulfatator indicus DSM 15286]